MSTRTLQNYLNTLPAEEAANLESVLALNNLTNLVRGEPGGGGVPTGFIVIAADDSSTEDKTGADVVCDGVDDQVEINAQLVNGNVHLTSGTFSLTDEIAVPSNRVLKGSGPETIVRPVGSDMSTWTTHTVGDSANFDNNKKAVITPAGHDILSKLEHITVRDLTVDCNRTAFPNESLSGVWVDAVKHMLVEQVIVKEIGTSITGHQPFGMFISRCDGVIINKCIIGDGGYDGITLRDRPINVQITNNYIWGTSIGSNGGGIQLVAGISSGEVANEESDLANGYIIISNNTIRNFNHSGFICHSRSSKRVKHVVFSNNTVVGAVNTHDGEAMQIQYAGEDIIIANNYVDARGDSSRGSVCIKIWNGSSYNPRGIILEGNRFRALNNALQIEELRHAVISNNVISAGHSAIMIIEETTSRLNIQGNSIRSGSSVGSIRANVLTHSSISNNIISNSSTGAGVVVHNGSSIMIAGNTITDIDNTADAILLEVNATDNFITGNMINPDTSIVNNGTGNTINNNMGNM